MRGRRFISTLVLMSLLLTALSTVAEAANYKGLGDKQRVARNAFSGQIGNMAHGAISDWAYYALQGMDPSSFVTPWADRVDISYRLPNAQRVWYRDGVRNESKYGVTDIMARYNDKDLRGGSRNWCSVYELKSWNERTNYSYLAQSQLLNYISAIDSDMALPCWGRRGVEWLPAIYPAWRDVPDLYTQALAKNGVKLQVTTTCTASLDLGECGVIWYRFSWKDEDNANSAQRSKHMGGAIWDWVNDNKVPNTKAGLDAQREQIDNQLIAKYEVNEADADTFQQAIDIVRPDGTIDPDVTNIGVMVELMDRFDSSWGSWWFRILRWLLVPAKGSDEGCPPNSQGSSNLPLCA